MFRFWLWNDGTALPWNDATGLDLQSNMTFQNENFGVSVYEGGFAAYTYATGLLGEFSNPVAGVTAETDDTLPSGIAFEGTP